ncbi:MAG: hypothetical protein ACLFWD_08895 [Anaerolineales bacterium]
MNQDAISQLREPHPQQKAIDAQAAALLRRTGKNHRREATQSSALDTLSANAQRRQASEVRL